MNAVSSLFQCDGCKKPTTSATAFCLMHPFAGLHKIRLCDACVGGLGWRADDPILRPLLSDPRLCTAYAGPMVRGIFARLRESGRIKIEPDVST